MQNKFTLLFFLPVFLNGQAAIELEKVYVLVAGTYNPITIAVDDLPDSCIVASVSYGTLEKSSRGHYSWHVLQDSNTATLTLTDQCNNELLGERRYKIRAVNSEILLGARYRSRQIDKKTFIAQTGLAAIVMEEGFDARCNVQSFHVRVIKKRYGKPLDGKNSGARFSDTILTWFKSVNTGDEIYFSEIMYQCPGMKACKESEETLKFVIK